MEKEISKLLDKVKNENNPILIAHNISQFIVNCLDEKKLNLYEAYMMNSEEIRFMRMGYTQPAWDYKVQISTCIILLNQKLIANIFDEQVSANKFKEMAIEAYNLNKEKREHYIIDRFIEFLDANEKPQLLEELKLIRSDYNKLEFDEGPYHNEYFPYDEYSPEEILQDNTLKNRFLNEKQLDGSIENLIVELNLI